MERKPGTVALYKQARKLAAELGFQLDEASTGGGSDGNFTAALGVPTLDGLGAVGEGAHAAHESILIEHLVPRTALLAALLATIIEARAVSTPFVCSLTQPAAPRPRTKSRLCSLARRASVALLSVAGRDDVQPSPIQPS